MRSIPMRILCATSRFVPPVSECGQKCLSGEKLTSTRIDQGKTVLLQVVDKCMGCEVDDLDLAPKAFLKLFGSPDRGRISQGTSWEWA